MMFTYNTNEWQQNEREGLERGTEMESEKVSKREGEGTGVHSIDSVHIFRQLFSTHFPVCPLRKRMGDDVIRI